MINVIKTYRFFIVAALIVSLSALYTSSCSTNPEEDDQKIFLPDSNLNYTDHIFPLFLVKCGSESGCHSTNFGEIPAQGLDLTRYEILIDHLIEGSEPIIIPGYGEQSFLYRILLEPLSGRRQMPPDRKPLDIAYIKGIKTWIDEGAHQFAQPVE